MHDCVGEVGGMYSKCFGVSSVVHKILAWVEKLAWVKNNVIYVPFPFIIL